MRVCGGIGSGVCSWLALVTGVGGYVLAGVEIGVLSVYFSIFANVRVLGVCVLVYAHTHTKTTWVLDVSPGVGRTPGGPEESRSTKAQYTCRPYRCRQYICLYICCTADFESRRCHDNQQITVSHFGEEKILHLESSRHCLRKFVQDGTRKQFIAFPNMLYDGTSKLTLNCLVPGNGTRLIQ